MALEHFHCRDIQPLKGLAQWIASRARTLRRSLEIFKCQTPRAGRVLDDFAQVDHQLTQDPEETSADEVAVFDDRVEWDITWESGLTKNLQVGADT